MSSHTNNFNDTGFYRPSKLDFTSLANGILVNSGGILSTTEWQSWTPRWTNISGGTLNYARYNKIGKTVFYKLSWSFSSGASIGSGVQVSLPVTATSLAGTGSVIGTATFTDAGTAVYIGVITQENPTTARLRVGNATSTYTTSNNITATIPITWGTDDSIDLMGNYEATS